MAKRFSCFVQRVRFVEARLPAYGGLFLANLVPASNELRGQEPHLLDPS